MDINEIYDYVQGNIPHGRVCLRPAEGRLLAGYVSGAIGDHMEIGTLWGGSAIIAALAKKSAGRNETVITIDPMDTEYWVRCDPSTSLTPTMEQVIANFQYFDVLDQIQLIRGSSRSWPFPLTKQFGSAFVDGDHRAEAVKQDFLLVQQIAPLLMFHDYNPLNDYKYNVVKALDLCMAEYQDTWEIVEHTETILVVRRRHSE